MPRKPYQSPREWLTEPDRPRFGLGTNLNWLTPGTPRETMLLRAAKQQHRIAQHIRAELPRQGLSTTDLADKADLHPDTVRAFLNGSNHATLADLAVLTNAVGLNFVAVARPPDDRPNNTLGGEPQQS